MRIHTQMTVKHNRALIYALAKANGWAKPLLRDDVDDDLFTVYDLTAPWHEGRWFRFQLDDANGDLIERWEGAYYTDERTGETA